MADLSLLALSEQKVKDTLKNASLTKLLVSIIDEAKNQLKALEKTEENFSKTQGQLLYQLGTKLKPQSVANMPLVVKYIVDGGIKNDLQVSAALEYLLSHTVKGVDVPAFEQASGVGVVVTNDQIEDAKESSAVPVSEDVTPENGLMDKAAQIQSGDFIAWSNEFLSADSPVFSNIKEFSDGVFLAQLWLSSFPLTLPIFRLDVTKEEDAIYNLNNIADFLGNLNDDLACPPFCRGFMNDRDDFLIFLQKYYLVITYCGKPIKGSINYKKSKFLLSTVVEEEGVEVFGDRPQPHFESFRVNESMVLTESPSGESSQPPPKRKNPISKMFSLFGRSKGKK